MEDEIVRADNRLRRRVQWLAGFVTVGGLITLAILYSNLRGINDLADEDLDAAVDQAVRLATVIGWITGLSFVGIGVWFLRLARRIRRSGRFPPPGMKVIKDTPVKTGTRARLIANLALATGLASALLGAGAAWWLCRLAVTTLGR